MSEAQQGTEAWLLERIGHVTGSRFHDVMARDKSGKNFLKSRETAITEITLELMTGKHGAMWDSKATSWGRQHEPMARMAYEAKTREFCNQVGFVTHKRHMQVGVSPDGLIEGKRKGWEAKCPYSPAVHLWTLLNGMPPEHLPQTMGGMWICDCDEWDFVSFHPLFPEPMQLYIQTIHRDDTFIDRMAVDVLSAVEEINSNVRTLLERYGVEQ